MTPLFKAPIESSHDTIGQADRRRRRRYGFAAAFHYRQVRSGEIVLHGSGRTIDMSAGGMLVELDEALPAGGRIEFAVDWPGIYHGAERVLLAVIGEVQRIDGRRAAVTIVHSSFRVSGLAAVRPAPGRAVA